MADTAAAFSNEDVGVDAAELSGIEALFDLVVLASKAEDSHAFRSLVDFSRLFARVKQKSRGVNSLST